MLKSRGRNAVSVSCVFLPANLFLSLCLSRIISKLLFWILIWFETSLSFYQILILTVDNVHAAYWDTKKGEVVLLDSVDISIAVATEKVFSAFILFQGY